VLALLAETAQPVLAYERVESTRRRLCVGCGMTLGASCTIGAVAGLEGAADGSIGRETDLVCLSEKGREAEIVDGT